MTDINTQIAIERLHQKCKNCRECELHKYRTNSIPWCGNHDAKLMIISDYPSAIDERESQLFSGGAGKIFDEVLSAKGFKRSDFYMTTLLKCRPTQDGQNDRAPRAKEIRICENFLFEQIQLKQPKFIICLGTMSAFSLLHLKGTIKQNRNKVWEYNNTPVIITYHPNFINRYGIAYKKDMINDFGLVIRTLKDIKKKKIESDVYGCDTPITFQNTNPEQRMFDPK